MIYDADKTYSFSMPSLSIDPSLLGISSVIYLEWEMLIFLLVPQIQLTSGVHSSQSITANSAVGCKDITGC